MVLRNDIKGVIFDFDNTLYENPPNKDDIFAEAMALSVLKLGFPGTHQEALAVARQSYLDHGSEVAAFVENYGMDERAIFHAQHEIGTPLMAQALKPSPVITAAFNKLARNYDLLIVTHATQHWADRLMAHLKLSSALKSGRILGLDHPVVDYNRKNEGPEVFERAASYLGLSINQLAVIEDTVGNLLHPHKKGMQTVFVNWGKPKDNMPVHVHHQVATIAQLKP